MVVAEVDARGEVQVLALVVVLGGVVLALVEEGGVAVPWFVWVLVYQ